MPKDRLPPLLAAFNGNRPAAPAWFNTAIAAAPTRTKIPVAGANIELLTWGEIGKPGLLLLHGGMAHADWWSFIAPFFSTTHRVAALSWSGMGDSDWRTAYSLDQYVEEIQAAIAAAGLDQSAIKPVIVSHSFGSFPTMRAAHLMGDKLGGVIIIDAPVLSPDQRAKRAEARKSAEKPPRETRVYASEAEALMRFRFSPEQTSDHPYIVDWIARTSLRRAPQPDGRDGWTWKFDPFMWSRLSRHDSNADLARATCHVAIVWGSQSSLFPADVIAYVRQVAPIGTVFVEIPEAGHHILADQPLALITAIRTLVSSWHGLT
jgi:pimeloyl-ACP methyl ester carboxylesterase